MTERRRHERMADLVVAHLDDPVAGFEAVLREFPDATEADMAGIADLCEDRARRHCRHRRRAELYRMALEARAGR